MREVIGDRTVDEVLTIGRQDIEIQRGPDGKWSAQFGVGLNPPGAVETVRPPAAVQAAFNEVNQAQQEKQTAINQAWATTTTRYPTPAARPRSAKNKRRPTRSGGSTGQGRHREISLLLAEYAKAPEITRRRLYFETMESILPALERKVIVDDSIKGILQTLPLMAPTPTATPPPQP